MDGITLKSLLVKSSVLHRSLSFVMFKVPQRQQLQSIHRLLNVPPVATVKLGNAYQFEKFGTKNRLLRYGIRIRCSKRLPGVRDAFSEAFGVKNRLFRYGRDIRYQKPPSTVRNRHSMTKRAPGVRDAFSKARGTAPATLNAFSKARRTADSTDCGQPPAAAAAASVRETAPARR